MLPPLYDSGVSSRRWVNTAAATAFNLTFSALTLDRQMLLNEHGLTGGNANETVLSILMLGGLVANGVAGLLARNRSLGKILAVGVFLLAASLAFIPFVESLGAAAVYAALLRVSGGVITVIYFGV